MKNYLVMYVKTAILFLFCQSALAGNLFNVISTGTPVPPYQITLCLDAINGISCETNTVSSLTLSITTTIDRSYPNAGFKSNNPSYAPVACANPTKGYCLFPASKTPSTISVYPVATPYSVGGSISGLNASGLVLQNNGTDDLSISANANSFNFSYVLANDSDYQVTIKTQPTRTFCTVTQGSGSNVTANITNVSITCTPVPVAYVSYSTTTDNVLQYCTINASSDPTLNGTVQSCTANPTPSDGWHPYGSTFATLNATPYAYVVSNRTPNALYACGITASTGAFTGAFGNPYCFTAYSLDVQPTGVAVATVGGTQYAYYTDNVRHNADVCTISSETGLLTCNSATPDFDPLNSSCNPWNPYSLTLSNIHGQTYAYVSAYLDNELYVCPVSASDGTFVSCSDAGGASGSWGPHAAVIETVNGTQYAYIASSSDGYVYQCSVSSSNGTLSSCRTSTPDGQSWSPQGIDFATINNTQYAYVTSARSDELSLFKCNVDSSGILNSCAVAYSTSSSGAAQETNITMEVIPYIQSQ